MSDFEMLKRKLERFDSVYAELTSRIKYAIPRIEIYLKHLREKYQIFDIQSDVDSIKFKIFGHMVIIKFVLLVTKNVGLMEWYVILPETDSHRKRYSLISTYTFDNHGYALDKEGQIQLKTIDDRAVEIEIDDREFVLEGLYRFCEKVDEQRIYLV